MAGYDVSMARKDLAAAKRRMAEASIADRVRVKKKYADHITADILKNIKKMANEGYDCLTYILELTKFEGYEIPPRHIMSELIVYFWNQGYEIYTYEHEDGIGYNIEVSWREVEEDD